MAGAHAQYIGIIDPNVQVVTTNTAPLPTSLSQQARKNIKNIRNYHSHSDVLTKVNQAGNMYDTIVGSNIYLANGVPTFPALTPSHTGYNFVEKEKLDKFDQKNLENKEIFTSRNGLKLYADMDEHIPIFVWSGDAIGAGAPKIKLDKAHLAELESYVHTRLSDYVSQIESKMKDVQQSVKKDHDRFEEYVDETKQYFKEVTHYKMIEGIVHSLSTFLKMAFNFKADDVITNLTELRNKDKFWDLVGGDVIISSLINLIEDAKTKFSKLISHGETLIFTLNDAVGTKIIKLFASPKFGFSDGVREEIMEHLNIVIPNIQKVNEQVEQFGDGINDIQTQMAHVDHNVMVNQVAINHQATQQTAPTIETSDYMEEGLGIIERVLINSISLYTSAILMAIEVAAVKIMNSCTKIWIAANSISGFLEKINFMAHKVPFAHTVAEKLSGLIGTLNTIKDETENLYQITSRALTIHNLKSKMKPFLENMLLTKYVLEDVRVLSSSAEGDAEMLQTELNAVVTALKQNEGNAIDSLTKSTQRLTHNLSLLQEQLDKTSSE